MQFSLSTIHLFILCQVHMFRTEVRKFQNSYVYTENAADICVHTDTRGARLKTRGCQSVGCALGRRLSSGGVAILLYKGRIYFE
jgi:hypothetical protein